MIIAARLIDRDAALRLVGLAEGEGCLWIARQTKGNFNCGFSIKLRADDREVLERVREACGGIGTVRELPRSNHWAPTVRWDVNAKREVGLLRDLFELYPFWSKKRDHFALWAEAVDFWLYSVGGDANGGTDWSTVAALKEQLHEVKRYHPAEVVV